MDVEATSSEDAGTVILYSHMDKQPEFEGWDEDKGPYKPVLQKTDIGTKLFGHNTTHSG